MNVLRKSLLFFALLSPSLIFSFNNDTTKVVEKTAGTKWFIRSQFENNDSLTGLNNSLYDFHKYISKNILGNTGLAEHEPIYRQFRDIGFSYSPKHYTSYYILPEKLKFYDSKLPYTDLFYVVGAKREQLFKGTFSCNFKKRWNVTADFCRIRSEGAYLRQGSNDNFISLSTNYKTKNNRYGILSSVIYNSIKVAENGGIADDSLFENFENIDEKLLLVNLISAKRTVENVNIYLKQILNFGEKSTDTNSLNYIFPSSRLMLNSSFDANSLRYQDDNPMSGFYSNLYYDTAKTFDSTFYSKIENELSWKRLDNRKHRGFIDMMGFGFNFKHELTKVHQRSLENSFNNFIVGGEVYNTYSSRTFWWNFSMNLVLKGYNVDDHLALLSFKKNIKDSVASIGLRVESRVQSPDFIYDRFLSNSFQWDTIHANSIREGGELSFIFKKVRLETNLGFYRYTNVLYFDTASMTQQFHGTINIFSAYLKKDITFFNWHFDNKITYQHLPDSSVIRIPNFISENSLYYENDLFKKALRLQVGASLYYTSAYYADAYMPVTDQFYLQDKKKYGNYPFVDVFINARIKTVRIFFKMDHINSGFSGKKYVLTPGYPYPERAFKFGVSWRFFD